MHTTIDEELKVSFLNVPIDVLPVIIFEPS